MEWPEGNIHIVCRDAGHPARRPEVSVTNFRRDWRGRWVEVVRRGERTGTWLVDDTVVPEVPGVEAMSAARAKSPGDRDRHRFTLSCRLCRRPYPFRSEKLMQALDLAAGAAKSEISLSELAATIDCIGD